MTISDRDRKILVFLVPVIVIVGYWFLLLAPKRQEAAALGEKVTQAQQERDEAVAEANRVASAKNGFADDLSSIIRVGKAIPTSVDLPSLIVQLNSAAEGTGIRFERIRSGERQAAAPASAPAAGGGSGTGGSTPPASGGQAASAPGQAAQQAQGAKGAAEQSGANAGAAPAASGSGAGGSGVAGLDTVPLEFTFSGSFFEMADLFHSLKRFVRVRNERLDVKGRLMSIDSFTLSSTDFPTIRAEVMATVYLAPKTEGATAGASPNGPAPAAGQTQPATGSHAPPSTPAATAAPAAR